jgi:hypothetical protein
LIVWCFQFLKIGFSFFGSCEFCLNWLSRKVLCFFFFQLCWVLSVCLEFDLGRCKIWFSQLGFLSFLRCLFLPLYVSLGGFLFVFFFFSKLYYFFLLERDLSTWRIFLIRCLLLIQWLVFFFFSFGACTHEYSWRFPLFFLVPFFLGISLEFNSSRVLSFCSFLFQINVLSFLDIC